MNRSVLFWTVCIPLRAAIARYSMTGDRKLLRAGAAVIGARWLAGLEKGHVGFFGGPVWWADQRRAHGVLWLLYASSGRGEWLAADVTFGAANWLSTLPLTPHRWHVPLRLR